MIEPPDRPEHRLDPDRAAAQAGRPEGLPDRTVIDTRPYRMIIGVIGLLLVIIFSVALFVSRGVQTAGLPAGKRLHLFVAPLATSGVNLDANTSPRCDPAHPNPEGLNVCGRAPLVLAFFATGSGTCEREVDTVQTVAGDFPGSGVQFAAVAVRANRSQTAALVRSRHWRIPVAYDRDGAVGALYNVSICPLLELAYGGGVVADRLIGNHWLSVSALAARVRGLVSG